MKNIDVRDLLKSLPLIEAPDSLDQKIRISLAKLDLVEPAKKMPFFTFRRFLATGAACAALLLGFLYLTPTDSLQTPTVISSRLNKQQVSVFDLSGKAKNLFEKENLTLKTVTVNRQKFDALNGGPQ